jgi:tRNA(fMet)-specific endonuclease VapC
MYLLDTDHLVIIQQQIRPQFAILTERMGDFSQSDFFVSIVSFHEEVLGWTTYLSRAKSQEPVVKAYLRLSRILTDFASLQVLRFDDAAADNFENLRGHPVRIGTMDLRIAATALSRNLTVLTRNLVDFKKVPGLRVEDWTIETAKAD